MVSQGWFVDTSHLNRPPPILTRIYFEGCQLSLYVVHLHMWWRTLFLPPQVIIKLLKNVEKLNRTSGKDLILLVLKVDEWVVLALRGDK